tara:strand:- start:57665 stop:57892 length:228 start_codon:yes stop_codon:yes gene_type:complete
MIRTENNFLNVSKEIDDFFEDYECSKKRLKLLVKLKSSALDFKTNEITIPKPKIKAIFKPKVKAYIKIDNSKSVF